MVEFCLMVLLDQRGIDNTSWNFRGTAFTSFPSKEKKWSLPTSLSRFANFPSRKFRRNGHGQALKMLWNSLEESSFYLFPRIYKYTAALRPISWSRFSSPFSFFFFLKIRKIRSLFFDLVHWNFRISSKDV